MTAKKRTTLLTVGDYAVALIACLTLVGMVYASIGKKLDEKIDIRIEHKTKYMEILLKQMATDEQKQRADKEYNRWENNK